MKLIRTKYSAVTTALIYMLLYSLILLMIVSVMAYRQKDPQRSDITYLDAVSVSVDGGPWQELTLPHTFHGLAPRTPVTLRATIHPHYDDCIYLRSVYAPAKLYLDSQLISTLGQPGSYPRYFADPPTEVRLVETHSIGTPMELQVEFASPVSRDDLELSPLMVGSSKDIIFDLGSRLTAPMVLAMVQIIVGCVLLIVSLFLILINSKGQVFFWLGLFSKFSGIWFLCENSFSILCFKNDSLLYILSFVGFFSFLIPLLRFIRIVSDCKDSPVLAVLEFLSAGAAITAIALQFAGVLPLHNSVFFFRFWIPLSLVITTVVVAGRAHRGNPYARQLLLPIVILTGASLLELLNRQFQFTGIFSSLFQFGMFLFLFLITFIAGLGFKDSLELKKKSDLLEQEKHILQIQTQEQRSHSLLLAKNEQELSRQRHDLRHHLAAIQELSGDNRELQDYLASLIQKIPQAARSYCENRVVNAILCHYAALCEQEGIALHTQLMVPETGSQDTDSDLCVIFANLLENAVEACQRMESGEKYIHLSSNVQYQMIAIAMENSFNGQVSQIGGRFRSSKRDAYGTGLSSVRSIAEAADGSADFQPHGGMFHSRIILRLTSL